MVAIRPGVRKHGEPPKEKKQYRKVALVLGSGDTLQDDVANFTGVYDGVVACNEAGVWWPGHLTSWVSLHADKFWKWKQERAGLGHSPAEEYCAHRQPPQQGGFPIDRVAEMFFPGQKGTGSSGLFAAKVALVDLGFEEAVLCGIPMTRTPHFNDDNPWMAAFGFQKNWLTIRQDYLDRMKSMSGWTAMLLGKPKERKNV